MNTWGASTILLADGQSFADALSAAADRGATAIVGADRFQTSALVARRLFSAPAEAGIATGLNFPDALAAGPWLARMHSPLLLAQPAGLPADEQSYLAGVAAGLTQVELYGGPDALGTTVETTVENAAASA